MADAVIALSNDRGFTFWGAFAGMLRGWALSEQGQVQEGLGQIRQGLAAWQATGARVERPLWLALLAETCAKAGLADEALALLTEGLAVAEAHGIHFHDAELLRLRGELLLSQVEPDRPGAEAALLGAIEVARGQGATSYEQRAAQALRTAQALPLRPT
jgi:predicted ATPase